MRTKTVTLAQAFTIRCREETPKAIMGLAWVYQRMRELGHLLDLWENAVTATGPGYLRRALQVAQRTVAIAKGRRGPLQRTIPQETRVWQRWLATVAEQVRRC